MSAPATSTSARAKLRICGGTSPTATPADSAFEPPASLALGFQDARLKCTGHVSYKQEGFPHLAGHTDLKAKVKGASLDLTLALGREGGAADAPPDMREPPDSWDQDDDDVDERSEVKY